MTKLKVGMITAAVALGIAVPIVIQHRMQTKLDAANEQLQQQIERNHQLADENENLSKQAMAEIAASVPNEAPSAELLKLRAEVSRLRAENSEASTPITHDVVETRYNHGQELARSGDFAGALKEFLWCFDEGMPRVTGYAGVRDSFLLSAIAKLGGDYPSALAALRERRDAALQRMLSSENDRDAARDFASINRELHDDQNTLTALDQLPAGDPRRRSLANIVFDQLVSAQRYTDAVSGRPYATVTALFDLTAKERPLPANITNPDMVRKAQRNYLINSTATSVEAFAGAGDLVNARALAERLLAYDNSPGTVAVLQQHLARAGQVGLLSSVTNN